MNGDMMSEYEREFEEKIQEKQRKEEECLSERKAAAERDLDVFYDQLTDKKAQRQAQNREHEEILKNEIENANNQENPFERVMNLIDSQAVSTEMQIMHSLLIRLKQQPVTTNTRRSKSSSLPSTIAPNPPPPPPVVHTAQMEKPVLLPPNNSGDDIVPAASGAEDAPAENVDPFADM